MVKDNQQAAFKAIIQEYLFPMFPGTTFEGNGRPKTSSSRHKLVSGVGGNVGFNLKPSKDSKFRFAIRRSQAFGDLERRVVPIFVEEMSELIQHWKKPYRDDVANALLGRTISRAVNQSFRGSFLSEAVSLLTEWSQQTYEGQRIAFSIGIESGHCNSGGPYLRDIAQRDFCKVLTNGQDTLVCCTDDGEILSHEQLGPASKGDRFAPVRFASLAEWTTDTRRAAICVNRNGEILVFSIGRLLFAKRRGKWRFFEHETAITQLANGSKKSWQNAVLQSVFITALDVSFARGGGCIGLCRRLKNPTLANGIVARDDRLVTSDSPKAVAISRLIGGGRFQDLDRRLRQELVSIDGATILGFDGEILAVGAVVNIPGGSSGGARAAAARAISKYGVGVKVSHDGYIQVFHGGGKRPTFSIG